MDYNHTNKKEYDECAIHGICSISASLSSMQEVILVYLETLAFYILEVAKLGLYNSKIRRNILEVFSGLTTNVEYSQETINSIISTLYENLFEAKEIYKIICKEKNITPKHIKTPIKISQQFNLANAIKQGQKRVNQKNQLLNENQKTKLNILLFILKSICLYITELQELNFDIDKYYKELLNILCTINIDTTTTEELDEIIEKSVKLDNELMQKTFDTRKAEFGDLTKTEVSVSTRPGKAILVTGANIKELELILKATQDKGIDIYTHGQMIIGHTFPKLKAYPHLVGHYGKGVEYCISDFSSFPGAIFLTKLALYNIGHLYHGRIFTSDRIAQRGVTALKNNDFEPLIQSALFAEGFTEAEPQKTIKIGLVEGEFMGKALEIADKIKTKKIKHLLAIGVSDNTESQKVYFEKFLELVKDDCFVFSASYTNNRPNVFSINLDYVFPFTYKTIDILMQMGIFADLNTTIFYTHCEPHTIPNLFMMKYIGIKNIYFGSCPPNLINPALIDSVSEMIGLNRYTNPNDDFENIIGGK